MIQQGRSHDPAFIGFLFGVASGAAFGMLTGGFIEGHGPYWVQIWTGLTGLVGGSIGLACGYSCHKPKSLPTTNDDVIRTVDTPGKEEPSDG